VLEDNAPYAFIAALAVAQRLQIEVLSIIWQSARQRVGRGKTSQIKQAFINSNKNSAFKRVAETDKRHEPEHRVFRSVVNEMIALRHPSIRNHPNIVRLQGIC